MTQSHKRLILVRHTAVELREGVPPEEWLPSAEGLEAARRLAASDVFQGVTLVASSPEPKAVATAEPIADAAGAPLRVEPDLRESERPVIPLISAHEHAALVGSYLSGEELAGWEPVASVRDRMTRCVDRLQAEAEGDLAVVSHGRALALFLGLSPEEWARLELPAIVAEL